MTGFHIGLQKYQVTAGVFLTQPRNPLGGLPVSDARIVEAAISKDVRVGFRLDVLIRAVGANGLEVIFAFDGVTPLRPFRRR